MLKLILYRWGRLTGARRTFNWVRWPTLLFTLFVLSGCGGDNHASGPADKNNKLAAELDRLLDQTVQSDKAIHGAVLLVDAPIRNFSWKSAKGWADGEQKQPMEQDDLFRAASLGKMTCATMVMRLMELELLHIDDQIGRYLPSEIIKGLHVYQGSSSGDRITIRQLLNHSSGLPDYIEDGDVNKNGFPDFLELLVLHPDQFWTPEATIAYAKENLAPFFYPGQGFHYSDTNYQLLGLIVEKATGKAFHEAYREFLFDPLGMNHTCLEFYEPPRPEIPGRGLSHVYFADWDYTDWASASADWAGGGIATTVDDLRLFLRAFADDALFADIPTKDEMLHWMDTGIPGFYYGLGIERVLLDVGKIGARQEIYGHTGFPNSFMFYWPKQDVIIVGTLNQAVCQSVDGHLIAAEIIEMLENGL